MKNTRFTKENAERPPGTVMVWDFPTRLFHWLLVILVIISFVSGKIGGNAMQYHEWSGFMILTLLLFRLVWGFAGGKRIRRAFERRTRNIDILSKVQGGQLSRAVCAAAEKDEAALTPRTAKTRGTFVQNERPPNRNRNEPYRRTCAISAGLRI